MMDGAIHNRTFISMHFSGHPKDQRYMTKSIADPLRQMVFVMDPAVGIYF